MAAGDLVEQLGLLGLDRSEATMYVFLATNGASKVSDLAASLGISRTGAYYTLQNLMRRGCVTAGLDRPVRYQAVPVQKLLDDAIASQQMRASLLADAGRRIAESLSEMAPARPAEGEPAALKNVFKIVRGRPEILALAASMVSSAASAQVFTTAPWALSAAEAMGVVPSVFGRVRPDLHLRLIVRDEGSARAMATRAPPGVEARFLATRHPMRYVLADSRQLLLAVVLDPSPDAASPHDIALWTDAEALVLSMGELFDMAWRQASSPAQPGGGQGLQVPAPDAPAFARRSPA